MLEVGADGVDFVDEVLDGGDTELLKVLLYDVVGGDGDTLLVDLGITALVDELTDSLEVGVSVGNKGLDDSQHLAGGLGESDEDAIVDLEETEELERLALLGVNLVDTLDTDYKDQLVLGRDVESVVSLCGTLGLDHIALCLGVLLVVLFGALENGLAFLLVGLRLS